MSKYQYDERSYSGAGLFRRYAPAIINSYDGFIMELEIIENRRLSEVEAENRVRDIRLFIDRINPLIYKIHPNLLFEYNESSILTVSANVETGVIIIKCNKFNNKNTRYENYSILIETIQFQYFSACRDNYSWTDTPVKITLEMEIPDEHGNPIEGRTYTGFRLFNAYAPAIINSYGGFKIELDLIEGRKLSKAEATSRIDSINLFIMRITPLINKIFSNIVFKYIDDSKITVSANLEIGTIIISSNKFNESKTNEENVNILIKTMYVQEYNAHIDYYNWTDSLITVTEGMHVPFV